MRIDKMIEWAKYGEAVNRSIMDMFISTSDWKQIGKWLKELKKLQEKSLPKMKGTKGKGGHPPVKGEGVFRLNVEAIEELDHSGKCIACDGKGQVDVRFSSHGEETGLRECRTCRGTGRMR